MRVNQPDGSDLPDTDNRRRLPTGDCRLLPFCAGAIERQREVRRLCPMRKQTECRGGSIQTVFCCAWVAACL